METCPICGAFHGRPPLEHLEPGVPCDHDRERSCRYCTRPVGNLSTGGPDVCARCEVVGVPPDIYSGRSPARDFHNPLKALLDRETAKLAWFVEMAGRPALKKAP